MQGITSDHIVPLRVYIIIAVALFALLGLTIAIARIDLGPFNIVAALAIAIVKMLLVVLFFLHVKYSSRLVALFAVGGVFWLVILFMFTLSDFMTR